jgi:2-hydroxy-6-oxonona-2,4-dienedioate hydrolase
MIYCRSLCYFLLWGCTGLTAGVASASVCSLSGAPVTGGTLSDGEMDRGEQKAFLLCGEGITADAALTGLDAARIEVLYRQSLQHCDVGDRRPGLFLVLGAGEDSTDANIDVFDMATGRMVCGDIPLLVPDRLLLPDATLGPTEQVAQHRLALTAGDGIDLTGACEAGLQFLPGPGFIVKFVEGESPRCRPSEVGLDVQVIPGRQARAKVLVHGIDLPGQSGRSRSRKRRVVDGISYVNPPPPAFLNAMAEDDAQFIDVDGVRTRYFEKGEGDAMILVHGGQPSAADFNAWEWQQNFDGLAEHFRVFALDRIGQGYTDNPADLDAYTNYYPLVVEHLHGFIRALGLERVHLVGHSQGGWPVTRLALDHPELVASLVIVDSTMVAPAANAKQAMSFYIYMQNDLHPEGGETIESIRRGMAFFSYTKNNITDQRVNRILALSRAAKYAAARDWFQSHYMSPAHPSFRVLKAQAWDEMHAGSLRVPTMILWGHEDPEGSFGSGFAFFEALREAGTDVRFHGFKNSGHVPYMEYPTAFNRLVTDFSSEYSEELNGVEPRFLN